MRNVGTIARGIRTPIIKENMNLVDTVVSSLMLAKEEENFEFRDKDIVGITEAVVAISDSNYVSVDGVAQDIKEKFNTNHIGVVFPILSRNRFSLILKSIARSMDKITMLLSFPSDEVGNHLFEEKEMDKHGITHNDTFSEKEYEEKFGNLLHPFTGINYVKFYRELIQSENCEVEFVFSNKAETILKYTENVLTCDIHTRKRTKEILKEFSSEKVYGLDDILTKPVNGSGYNENYGLLGSNKSTEEKLKLFPRNGMEIVEGIQKKLKEKTGKDIEVLVYGDGAFKDPIGKIWELADPCVSPAYTKGLEGTPNEIKLKYISDNKFSELRGEELKEKVKEEIRNKSENLKGTMSTQGTTPRRYVDLIGSLCDLISGSGDKGTPVVFIQGYFDNLADD